MPIDPNVGPPTQPTNLPDFRPKGMSTIDKCFAWTMAFLIVITLIVFANRALNEHIYEVNHPAVKATPTVSVSPTPHVKKDKR
jgi:hypothetical protein